MEVFRNKPHVKFIEALLEEGLILNRDYLGMINKYVWIQFKSEEDTNIDLYQWLGESNWLPVLYGAIISSYKYARTEIILINKLYKKHNPLSILNFI